METKRLRIEPKVSTPHAATYYAPLTCRSTFFQSAHPVLVKILTQEFYVIRGPENVKALFKSSGACTSIPFVKFALGYAFGLPAKALGLYDKDDSGGGYAPHPGSTVEARNRIDYRVHVSLVQFLEGRRLVPFWNRFADNITHRLHGLHDRIGTDWVHRADLMRMVGDEAAVSILNALCGPYLLSLNPHFLQDYWDFDRNLQTYLQGMGTKKHTTYSADLIRRHTLVSRPEGLRGSEEGSKRRWSLAAARKRPLQRLSPVR